MMLLSVRIPLYSIRRVMTPGRRYRVGDAKPPGLLRRHLGMGYCAIIDAAGWLHGFQKIDISGAGCVLRVLLPSFFCLTQWQQKACQYRGPRSEERRVGKGGGAQWWRGWC